MSVLHTQVSMLVAQVKVVVALLKTHALQITDGWQMWKDAAAVNERATQIMKVLKLGARKPNHPCVYDEFAAAIKPIRLRVALPEWVKTLEFELFVVQLIKEDDVDNVDIWRLLSTGEEMVPDDKEDTYTLSVKSIPRDGDRLAIPRFLSKALMAMLRNEESQTQGPEDVDQEVRFDDDQQ